MQSLWIDFRRPSTVESIDVAWIAFNYWYNANSVQIFGYDDHDRLVGETTPVTLSKNFETTGALMFGVRYLEIRADRQFGWFGVDNLIVHTPPATVPVPGAFWLMATAATGLACSKKRKPA